MVLMMWRKTGRIFMHSVMKSILLAAKHNLALFSLATLTGASVNFFRTDKESKHPIESLPVEKKGPISYSIMATGSADEIRMLAEDYTQDHAEKEFKELLETTTCRGNNSLHLAAQYNTPEGIVELLTIMGEEILPLTTQSNHSGKPPIRLLNQNKTLASKGKEEIDKLTGIMFPLTRSAPTSELSQLIDSNELFSERYSHIKSEHFKYNLKMAVLVINETREAIKKSSTHHAINLPYSKTKQDEMKEVTAAIISMRRRAFFASLFSFKDASEIRARYALEREVGNCGELAVLVYVSLKKKGFNSSCEIFEITNGDHVFNVIDRLPGSKLNDPSTWGENALIADAWSGDVYLASELPLRLKAYHFVNYKQKEQHYLAPFNPYFHKFKIHNTYYPDVEKKERTENSQCTISRI